MMDNNLVSQFWTQINNAIDYKLSSLTSVKSAIVHSVNQNGTVNISIPPSQIIYHNIQNQSIYRSLQTGDQVKVLVENGNLSNMWIIGGFQLSTDLQGGNSNQPEESVDLTNYVTKNNLATEVSSILSSMIVVSSTAPSNPPEGMIWIEPIV